MNYKVDDLGVATDHRCRSGLLPNARLAEDVTDRQRAHDHAVPLCDELGPQPVVAVVGTVDSSGRLVGILAADVAVEQVPHPLALARGRVPDADLTRGSAACSRRPSPCCFSHDASIRGHHCGAWA
ncbi:hypothetical protein E4N62_26425 [Streptomyces sp. MNU76]|nr:hypothetical protein [Streptomyces sp. MNU76]MCC9708486.1 hypothetical protein [Streptomyces sp. MNU76]